MTASIKPPPKRKASQREGMDARIRARRAHVRADAVKRRQRRTLSLFALLIVVAGVSVALRSSLFEITDIEVRGAGSERAAVVRRIAGISQGQHLLTAPLEQAQARVETLPWVKRAVVHRAPPSTVAIDVIQRRPLLTVETGGSSWQVDEDSVLVNGGPVKGAPVIEAVKVDLPKLGGVVEAATVRAAVAVHPQLPEWLRNQVEAYEGNGTDDLTLRLAVASADEAEAQADPMTVRVRFGAPDDLALKSEVIRVLLPQAVEQERDLDVRAPANPVVVEMQAAAAGGG